MKDNSILALAVLVTFACLCSSACAWTAATTVMTTGRPMIQSTTASSTRLQAITPLTRRDTLTKALTVTVAASAAILTTSVQNVNAATTRSTKAPLVAPVKPKTTCTEPCFTGVWFDPNHTCGYRVLVQKSGTVATMVLNDGGKEFYTEPDTYTNRPVKIITNKKQGTVDLDFDFRFKGGPKIVGRLSEDGNKIFFPDGNVWSRNHANDVEGVYATDPRVAGEGYRVVVVRGTGYDTTKNEYAVQLNSKQAITATVEKPQKENRKKGDRGDVGLRFAFPNQTPVDATYKDGEIFFPFPVQSNASGNIFTKWDKWTKL